MQHHYTSTPSFPIFCLVSKIQLCFTYEILSKFQLSTTQHVEVTKAIMLPRSWYVWIVERVSRLCSTEMGMGTQTGMETGMGNRHFPKFEGGFGGSDIPNYPNGAVSGQETTTA